nr:hypothetical protein [Tanacetum cinerariifolium]
MLQWSSNCAPTSKNRSSSTEMVAVGVATGEAMGDGLLEMMVKHARNQMTTQEMAVFKQVQLVIYPDTSFVWEGSEMMMMMMVSHKTIYTSYRKKMGTKQLPSLFGRKCPGIGSVGYARPYVRSYESDEIEEWDETVLVPDGSEALNSLLIKGTLEPNGCNSSASEGASSGSDSVSVSTNCACLTLIYGSLDTDSEGGELGDEDTKEDDEGHGLEDEGPNMEEEDEVVPGGQQQAVSVVDTAMNEPLGLGYRAARRCALESTEEIAPSTYEVQLVDTDTESDPEEAPLEAEELQPLGSRVPLMSKEFKASEPSGQLDDLGCKVEIENKIMKIIKGTLVLMEGEKNDSSEVVPQHEVNETNESQVPATPALNHERKHLVNENSNVRDDKYKTKQCTCSGSSDLDGSKSSTGLPDESNQLLQVYMVSILMQSTRNIGNMKVQGRITVIIGDLDGSKSSTGYVFTLCGRT